MILCLGGLGAGEILLIVVIAILVLGPEKTPVYAKKLGEGLAMLKQYSGKLAGEIKENVAEPLSEVVQPLQEVTKEINEPFKDLTDPLKEIKAPLDEAAKAVNDAVRVTAAPLKKAVDEAAEEVEKKDAEEAVEETAEEAAQEPAGEAAQEPAEPAAGEEPVGAADEEMAEDVPSGETTEQAVSEAVAVQEEPLTQKELS